MSCQRFFALALTLSAAIAWAGPAWAQPGPGGPGGPGGGFGRGFGGFDNPVMLLASEQVAKELELSKDQQDKLRQIRDDAFSGMRDQFSGLRDLPADEREAKIAELREKAQERMKEVQEKVKGILLPHQAKRLEQISFQMRTRGGGISAITADPAMVKKLGLTDAQVEQLKKIGEEAREKLQKVPQQIMEESKKKAMDVLTAEQKKMVEDLTGTTFEMQFPQFGQGGMRGRGGPAAKPQP